MTFEGLGGFKSTVGSKTSRSSNPFNDHKRFIFRLDALARNEELQEKLQASDEWDLGSRALIRRSTGGVPCG